jgi:predicted metalloprotease with PDZ domain
MRKSWLFCCLLVLSGLLARGQAPIRYAVFLDDIRHHELRIRVTFPAVPTGPFTLRMAQASPGRYAVHHFAKNVYDAVALSASGDTLPLSRSDLAAWQVSRHEGKVIFEYTLYANHADGTYSGVDNRKLHLNVPATFIYAPALQRRPIELRFDLSDYPDWSVATQLEPIGDQTFRAPNYPYFMDSPILVGDLELRSWTSDAEGKAYTIRMAVLHEGTDEELDAYTEWVQRIVEEEKAIFGGLPAFDFGTYTFLMSYNPYVYGDGMEHRNSTICSSQRSLATGADRLIGTVAHEFFHAWNVERLRPQSLEPFDFYRANLSEELWFAEGFTSYYDDLVLCRAGIRSPAEYAQGLTGTLNYVLNSPGRRYRNPKQMSQHAPFVDAATAIDEDNHRNTFISYYSYGAVIGLALDLSLRQRFEGVTLDDFMRALWEQYGQGEVPYEIQDLELMLAEVCGDSAFAAQFFDRYIHRSQLPDLRALLEDFGLALRPRDPGQSDLTGLKLSFGEAEGATVAQPILVNHSLYAAGLNQGDQLLGLNGQSIDSPAAFEAAVAGWEQGSRHEVRYQQNGKEETGSFVLQAASSLEVQLLEATGEALSPAVRARREAWLKQE